MKSPAGAVLLGFDAATLNALAIAGSHSAGLIEYTRAGGSVTPGLLAAAPKIRVVVADDAEWEKVDKGAGLEVETVDRWRFRACAPLAKGLPENPMSPEEAPRVRRRARGRMASAGPAGRTR